MGKEKYYIDKDELWEEIEKFYILDDAEKDKGRDGAQMGNKLGTMLTNIAQKLMTAQNFSGYPYRDEMEGDAKLRMVATLIGRKFALYSPKNGLELQKHKFRGYRALDVQLAEDEVLVMANDDLTKAQHIYKKSEKEFFMVGTKRKPYYVKTGIINNCFERSDNPTSTNVDILGFVETGKYKRGKPIYVDHNLYDTEGEQIFKRNNAFGYLSLISTREAITRIKRENKNFDAVHAYQEEEFLSFMSDNPEMAPQRIYDDTYEIFIE